MKTAVSRYDFERAFSDAGRKDQFSYEGDSMAERAAEEERDYQATQAEEIEG